MSPDTDSDDDWTKYADTGYESSYDPWADMVATEDVEEDEDYVGVKIQDLIKLILEAQAKKVEKLYATGCLEILSDGYGFLRSSECSYLPGPDDIYVPHSQIKRFRLRTGNIVAGQIRPPKEKERFFALLRVDTINGNEPDSHRNIIHFDNLTPLYPEEQLKLEVDPKGVSTRVIDILAPIGKGPVSYTHLTLPTKRIV